jgi:hypothetical protein
MPSGLAKAFPDQVCAPRSRRSRPANTGPAEQVAAYLAYRRARKRQPSERLLDLVVVVTPGCRWLVVGVLESVTIP